MRTRNDWQIIEVVLKAVMKRLLILTALLALSASAATEYYTIILVTRANYADPQIGNFPTLRECTIGGAKLLLDQNIYAGFRCVLKEQIEYGPEEVSEVDPQVPLATRASAQETTSDKHVEQTPKPYVLTLLPQFLEGVEAFDTRDACVERGIELLNTVVIFNGFICGHGRAWQKD